MSVRPYRDIYRRKSRQIFVGNVPVGGDAPITVQSMTNTLTTDVAATVAQIQRLEEAGADIVRVSCPDEGSTAALKSIEDLGGQPAVTTPSSTPSGSTSATTAPAASTSSTPSTTVAGSTSTSKP